MAILKLQPDHSQVFGKDALIGRKQGSGHRVPALRAGGRGGRLRLDSDPSAPGAQYEGPAIVHVVSDPGAAVPVRTTYTEAFAIGVTRKEESAAGPKPALRRNETALRSKCPLRPRLSCRSQDSVIALQSVRPDALSERRLQQCRQAR